MHKTILQICIVIATTLLLFYFVSQCSESGQINKLGERAKRRKYFLICCGYIISLLKNEEYEFWRQNLGTSDNRNNPWTIEAGDGPSRIILTVDPENIKAILSTQFQDYGKGERFNRDWHALLGNGIFTTDGEKWQKSRHLIQSQFTRKRLSNLTVFERHVDVLITKLGCTGDAVDVADLFFRYTLDVTTDFLLGRSVDSLSHKDGKFANAFNEAQRIQSAIVKFGYWKYLMPRGEFFNHLEEVDKFVNSFVDDVLQISPEELQKTTKSDEGYTFLHALAADSTRDRKDLRDQIVAVLLAGRDTTACTLSWIFYELSQHPDVFKKLREEILEQIGTSRMPKDADLKHMRYLRHTIDETLRLYPAVPFNVRLALEDSTLPHGGGPNGNQPVRVPRGTPVCYSTLVMQRQPDFYAGSFEHPDQFVPERWENWTPGTWQYIPFNKGPRICIGQQFALTEMAYTIVRILQKYERIECRITDHPGWKTDIVLAPKRPVMVAFYEGA